MSDHPDTAGLLDEVETAFRRYVVLQGDHFYCAVALWVAHAHAIRAAETSPRLLFTSPEKESGKTRGLEVLEVLVPGALPTMNCTIAALFRLLADSKLTTLLIDEADAIWSPKAAAQHEDLRALLNAGYRRGADVARVVGQGSKMHVRRFPVFAATALASIGNVPETLWSRSIVIPMRRRAADEHVDAFRRRHAEDDLGPLRADLEQWAERHVSVLSSADPNMPDGLTDRAADIWEPLLAIADLAEGEWPERARQAALEIVDGRVVQDQSVGVRLLLDVRTVLDGHQRISSADLVSKLNELEESSWGGWHDGKGITQRELANRLNGYDISSKTIRIDERTPKGYESEDFADAFARYLRDTSATSATKRNNDSSSKDADVADVVVVLEEEERRISKGGQTGLLLFARNADKRNNEFEPVAHVADLALLDDAYELDQVIGAELDAECAALAENEEA